MKNTTIRDVARVAGVSISSVSRYLKEPSSINPIAAIAVRDAIKELNYVPNPFAQNLKKESNNVIAVLLPDISHSFFARTCRSLEKIFYQNNYLMMICDTDDDPQKEQFYIEEMLKTRAAGLMIASSGNNAEYLKKMVEEHRHIMLYDRAVEGVKANLVCENNREAGVQLTEHMIEKGCRSFAVIGGNRQSSNAQLRLEGIREACERNGVRLEENFVYQDVSEREDVEKAVREMLDHPHRPDCLITCNPRLTDSVVVAANKLHLKLPEQLQLCGFTIDDPRQIYAVPMCAMCQDPYQVGLKAGEMMLRMLKNKTKSRTVKQTFLPMKLYD